MYGTRVRVTHNTYLTTLAFYKTQGIIYLYTFYYSASAAQEPTLYATKNSGTAHDLLLDEQSDAMIEANELRLVYLARHHAIHARLVEASDPNTSISSTVKAIVRGLSRSGQHLFAYMKISLKAPTSMAEISEIFTMLQQSVEVLARHSSAMNAHAGQHPRHERVRQRGRRPLGNYPRPEGRPARLKWCTVYGSGGHNSADCRQAPAAHVLANVAERYAKAAHPAVNDILLCTTSPTVIYSGATPSNFIRRGVTDISSRSICRRSHSTDERSRSCCDSACHGSATTKNRFSCTPQSAVYFRSQTWQTNTTSCFTIAAHVCLQGPSSTSRQSPCIRQPAKWPI
jgi:hypothetical protein